MKAVHRFKDGHNYVGLTLDKARPNLAPRQNTGVNEPRNDKGRT